MDAQRFRVRTASPRGFRQAYVREGGGVPLLLIHGWPETMRIWWRNIEPLAAAGFDVIAPDLRGFGASDVGPDGFHDSVSHSLDLHALAHDELGIDSAVVVAGNLGGAVAQDLAMRFPGFVERLVIFNAPVPYLRDEMRGLRTRPPAEATDYFLRQGNDADALAAELDTPERRRRYVASFYTSRRWAHPGCFDASQVAFMCEPFGDAARLRASFGAYESALHEDARLERPFWGKNPTPALILFGASDHVIAPDFDRMAAIVFPDHVGPFHVRDAGHFLQWEAADLLNGAVRGFCGDLLARSDAPAAGEEACVALGSNLGEREARLAGAIAALRGTRGVRVSAVSAVYETEPVGPPPQGRYLNAALRLRTTLSARALLERLHAIEAAAGRSRGRQRNAARSLDLDLLLYGDRKIDEPGLCVPHPRLHERPFVLEPLREVAADWRHPLLGESVAALAERVRDAAAVRRRNGRVNQS